MVQIKSIQMSLMLRQCASKPFTTVESRQSITEIIKKLRVYMVLGDVVSTLNTFVWILNLVSRCTTCSLFTLKVSVKPGQMTNLNAIFHVVVSGYRAVKI